MLFLLACTVDPPPVFVPREDLAGSLQTPFGNLRSAGVQHLCQAPEVRVGTVVDVGPPEPQTSGLRTQRLTFRTERTLRGAPTDAFVLDVTGSRRAPAPGPGRYLLATSTTGGRTGLLGTLDIREDGLLPTEAELRGYFDRLCAQAARWPESPLGTFEP